MRGSRKDIFTDDEFKEILKIRESEEANPRPPFGNPSKKKSIKESNKKQKDNKHD